MLLAKWEIYFESGSERWDHIRNIKYYIGFREMKTNVLLILVLTHIVKTYVIDCLVW